jgi:hypothetical protein
MRRVHDGLDWGSSPASRPPTVAELREWLTDKPDDAIFHARDSRIWITNFGEAKPRPDHDGAGYMGGGPVL